MKPFSWPLSLGLFLPLSCAAPAGVGSSTAIANAAASECRAVDAKENPLHDPARIADMQVLVKKGLRGNVLGEKDQGVAIALRPERGLTREWLTHVLACDQAEPQHADATCPLALPGAQVTVDAVQGQLVVYVRYSNPQMVARAVQLVERFHGTQGEALARGM
ncbi:MAG TPA: hypothetical protein VHB79_37000 [Polyangiaceae bacterium]|nr:hypothetical protein [Polyangiaceae bacterium]